MKVIAFLSTNKTLNQTKHGYKTSNPKTNKSAAKVKVTLDSETIMILKRWQINQRKHMFNLGITDPIIIFCGIYKQMFPHHVIFSRMKTIIEKYVIPFLGIHITRHTYPSMLLDARADMKEVQDRLHHASINMTMDTCSHLSKETKDKATKKLVAHLNF